MPSTEVPGGTIDYIDTGGSGRSVVLLHGLLMDSTLWDDVVAALGSPYRCIVPTLPLGAHSRPMDSDADLSLGGIARMVTALMERLDLLDAVLVGNDTGGAIVQLLMCEDSPRVAAVVLVSCDAYDNFPPGLTGKTVVFTGKLPARLFGIFMQQMRLRPLRRLPIAFGWLTKRGDAACRRWVRQLLRDRGIRRDAVRVLRAMGGQRSLMDEAAECHGRFDRPALVVWAAEDRVMPPSHAERLKASIPGARRVLIKDCYTLIPLDQPQHLAEEIASFAETL
jgi:pimeloyl-ACP methyl ester carboxylesterase